MSPSRLIAVYKSTSDVDMPETLKILHLGQDDVVWLVMVNMTKSEITSETTRTAGSIKFDFRTG